MNIKEINAGLKIVKLQGERFKAKFANGYYVPVGHCFWHPEYGYVAFSDSPFTPYIPSGGKKALESILKAGGFNSFEGMLFVKPI